MPWSLHKCDKGAVADKNIDISQNRYAPCVLWRLLPSTMHLLCLGPIMKHAAILLVYMSSPKTSTKTKLVCDSKSMVWLCSHFCSSWRPRFLVPHSFLSLVLVGENALQYQGYNLLHSKFLYSLFKIFYI